MTSASTYEREVKVWEKNHIEDCCSNNLFEGKNVLEVGGILPLSYVEKLNVKSWTCIDLKVNEEIKTDKYKVFKGDIVKSHLEANTYDTVISTNSFEHIDGLDLALQNIYKSLKKGGFLSALFGPIWSSHIGHHIWISEKLNFTNKIIPSWGHLIYNQDELRELIKDKYPKDVVDIILYQVFDVESFNRMHYEDYINVINTSLFEIKEIRDWHKPLKPSDTTYQYLKNKYSKENFHSISLKILLKK